MKALIDTNVLLDNLLRREPFYEDAKKVVSYCLFREEGFIAAHSFADMFFLMHERNNRSVEYCRNTFLKLCRMFEVCDINKEKIIAAAENAAFDDFEDALQAECADSAEVDCIVTRNPKDFAGSSVVVYSPKEFVLLMENQ